MSAVLETLGWASISAAVWLATLSSVTLPELCFALGAGVLCGALACAARRALGGSWRPSPRWILWLGPLALSILAETIDLLAMAIIRPRAGRLSTYHLPDEPLERLMAREALGTMAISATPGSVVADCDPADPRLTVHVLVSKGPSLPKVIRR